MPERRRVTRKRTGRGRAEEPLWAFRCATDVRSLDLL